LAERLAGLQQTSHPIADSANVNRSGRRAQLEPTPPVIVLDDLIADNGEQFLPAQRVQPGTEISGLFLAAVFLAAVGRTARPPPGVARSPGRAAPNRRACVAHDRQPDGHAVLAEESLLPIRATALPPESAACGRLAQGQHD